MASTSLTRARQSTLQDRLWRSSLCFGRACAFGAVLLGSSCAAPAVRSAIASGERPVTGDARFDKFFAEVSELHGAVKDAAREESDVRAQLSRRVALSGDAPMELLGARLRDRTAQLAREGLTLELEFTGVDEADDDEGNREDFTEGGEGVAGTRGEEAEPSRPVPSATLRTPGREPERRELRLLKVIAQASLSGATVYAQMGQARHKTAQLVEQVAALEGQVDSAFADAGEREKVRAKLLEAEQFLPDLHDQAEHAKNEAEVLIALLDEAANTAPPKRRPTAPAAPPRQPTPAASPPAPHPAPKPPSPTPTAVPDVP
jgi:hypothetical protein